MATVCSQSVFKTTMHKDTYYKGYLGLSPLLKVPSLPTKLSYVIVQVELFLKWVRFNFYTLRNIAYPFTSFQLYQQWPAKFSNSINGECHIKNSLLYCSTAGHICFQERRVIPHHHFRMMPQCLTA